MYDFANKSQKMVWEVQDTWHVTTVVVRCIMIHVTAGPDVLESYVYIRRKNTPTLLLLMTSIFVESSEFQQFLPSSTGVEYCCACARGRRFLQPNFSRREKAHTLGVSLEVAKKTTGTGGAIVRLLLIYAYEYLSLLRFLFMVGTRINRFHFSFFLEPTSYRLLKTWYQVPGMHLLLFGTSNHGASNNNKI